MKILKIMNENSMNLAQFINIIMFFISLRHDKCMMNSIISKVELSMIDAYIRKNKDIVGGPKIFRRFDIKYMTERDVACKFNNISKFC
jgi:hypothetical protein